MIFIVKLPNFFKLLLAAFSLYYLIYSFINICDLQANLPSYFWDTFLMRLPGLIKFLKDFYIFEFSKQLLIIWDKPKTWVSTVIYAIKFVTNNFRWKITKVVLHQAVCGIHMYHKKLNNVTLYYHYPLI